MLTLRNLRLFKCISITVYTKYIANQLITAIKFLSVYC